MTEFIVLGTIPGTSIHIDFSFWLMLVILFGNVLVLQFAYKRRAALNHWLAGYIMAVALHSQLKQPRLTA